MRNHPKLPLQLRRILPLHSLANSSKPQRPQGRFLLRIGPVRRFDLLDFHEPSPAFASGSSAFASSAGASAFGCSTLAGTSTSAAGASSEDSAASPAGGVVGGTTTEDASAPAGGGGVPGATR